MPTQTLIYDKDSQSIKLQESGHHVAVRHQNRWICQPEKAVGPELSSKLFMAITYVHSLRWGSPAEVVPNLQMLVDVGDLALSEPPKAPESMQIQHKEYSDTIRLFPQNYLLASRDPADREKWICDPDPAVPHEIGRKAFLLLQMKDGFKGSSGEFVAGKLENQILQRNLENEVDLVR